MSAIRYCGAWQVGEEVEVFEGESEFHYNCFMQGGEQ